MSIQINNPGDSFPNDKKTLKFRSAEQLGGSIFISDNNNIVEISDIQGNKFQSLIDLLRPAIEKKEEWTQELINNVEKLIKKHNKDKIKNKAEQEIETINGWTRTKTDRFGRETEFINNDGRTCKREYSIINGYNICTETYTDSEGNLLLTEFNGQQYSKIIYENSRTIGETTDGKRYVLKEVQNKKINNYFYDENGQVIDIKITNTEGKEINSDYSGLRSEQYMQFSLDLRTGDIIAGYKIGQNKNIVFNGEKDVLKQLNALGLLDAHGNIVRMGGCLQESGTYTPSETDIQNLKYVFGKTKFADNFSDHNQMLDVMEHAKEQLGISLDDVTVLINCDTHSDVYLNSVNVSESIADWVNTCLAKTPSITDFYWVVSENMVNDTEVGKILNGELVVNRKNSGQKPLLQNVDIKADLNNNESVQTYYINNETGKIYANTIKSGRPIRIHICTEKNLPDFKGQKIISTFDMDYFSNSGIDTATSYRDNKTADELNIAFSKLLQTFADHHIQPIIHGNCYSDDDYLPKEDLPQAKQFSDAIINATPQKEDMLEKYKHHHY